MKTYQVDETSETLNLNGAPSPPPAPRRSRIRAAVIAAFAALLIAGVAIAAIVIVNNNGSKSSAAGAVAAYQQKLTSVLTPLVSANQTLSSALQAIDGSKKSIAAAQNATTQAQAAVVSARGAIAVLSAPASQVTLSQQVQQALTQENGYLQAVGATLADPIGQSSSQLRSMVTNTQTTFIPLASLAAGLSTSLTGTDNLLSWVSGANGQAQKLAQKTTVIQQTTTVQAGSPPVPTASGMQYCDQNIQANADTSCPFAENVFVAYWNSGPPWGNANVTAYSPVTNQSYTDYCSTDGVTVSCSHGTDLVVFPMSVVQAY